MCSLNLSNCNLRKRLRHAFAVAALLVTAIAGAQAQQDQRGDHGGHDAHQQFRIGAYILGDVRAGWSTDQMPVVPGGDFTFYSKPVILDSVYGNGPKSSESFLRIRPGRTKIDGHSGHSSSSPGRKSGDGGEQHDTH